MRQIKVLYVEDDPALMSLVAQQLESDNRLELVCLANDSQSSLGFAKNGAFDVALLDLALGRGSISGLELAISLRVSNPNCGLVIFSQHSSAQLVSRIPIGQRFSFSVLEKKAPIDFELLISTLVTTAQGFSLTDESLNTETNKDSVLEALSQRDHQIMRLLMEGRSTDHISAELSLASVTVRQELSRIYSTLVPEKLEGTNLRTKAIMRYLEEVRAF
jgi:DNA-binding NarL/FixJ family response regulator